MATGVLAPRRVAGCGRSPAAPPAEAQRRAGEQFFETKVRPILAEHCYKCHGPDRHKANLRLDSLHAMLAGGDSGPAIIAGDAEHSLLMQVISYSDDYVQMPPTKKLPDALIADLTRWVQMGAPWPGAEHSRPARRAQGFRNHGQGSRLLVLSADSPPQRAEGDRAELGRPIRSTCSFLQCAREERARAQSLRRRKRELIRRAFFDLIGLPPTPAEVDGLWPILRRPLTKICWTSC